MVWRDLITPNARAAEAFYGGLLGWTFEPVADSGYSLILHEGRRIGGLVDAQKLGRAPQSAYWLSAVSVPDVDAAVARVAQAGGRVLRKPGPLPERGRTAVVEDGQGALLQLLRTSAGDPPAGEASLNGWLWTELISDDVEESAAFCQAVLGYQTAPAPQAADPAYRLLQYDGSPRAGLLKNPFLSTRPAWIPYVRVKDASAMAEAATALGGQVVLRPDPAVRGGTVALILDPSGAPLALQQWTGPTPKGGAP